MIPVYFSDIAEPDESIGGFLLPAVPRIGDRVYFSYSRMLQSPNRFAEDALAHAKAHDNTVWLVTSVQWEASYDGDGRATAVVQYLENQQ